MDANHRRVEKRNRPPVSCELCRTRKLKCNRELPCDTCVKRNKSSLCHYAANANRAKTGPSRTRDMKDRLNTLETLVSSILTGNATIQQGAAVAAADDQVSARKDELGTPSTGQFATPTSSSSGRDKGDAPLHPETPHLQETADGQMNYIDAGHWQSILDDIKEVREHLSGSDIAMPQSQADIHLDNVEPDASFTFQTGSTTALEDILSSLPPQPICDKLLSWYFQSRFLVQGLIHPGKFQQEYEAFWEAPTATSPLWIALLFAILSITSILRSIALPGEADASIPSAKVLQRRTVQCLVLGQYATANAHALEAFLLHLQCCFIGDDYRAVNVWFEMGTIIRLAFRMGYHRDPRHLPGISPFDGEMRRRLWLNLFQIEAVMSFQMGLPSMIPTEFCDTELPRNLEYSDLRVDMETLPAGRPLTEVTPVQYSVAKAGVMGVFKRIVAQTQALAPPAYERTLALDIEMEQAYEGLPETLKSRDVNRSFMDPAGLILQRCTLEMLHLKGTIVLHRRYINCDAASVRFERSQQACVEAALRILARQADLHRACAPGGRLYEDRWMMASLPIQDFLLAAMVLCMDLSVRMRLGTIGWTELADEGGWTLAGREYRALQTSQQIWTDKSATSSESHIAALALELMINKVAEKNPRPNHKPDTNAIRDDRNHSQSQHLLPAFDTSVVAAVDLELPYAGPMSQMIDGSENIDWDAKSGAHDRRRPSKDMITESSHLRPPSMASSASPGDAAAASVNPTMNQGGGGNTSTARKVNRSCLECTRRKVKCDGRQPCGSCVYYRSPEVCGYRQRSKRNAVSRSTFEKAAEQLQNQSRILETLFPGVDVADLLGKSQSELLDLVSGRTTLPQPTASTTSTTVSATAPTNVHGASPDDRSFAHQPSREMEDSAAVSDNGDPPAERRYDEPMDGQPGSVASDDINAIGLAIDHRIRSYLGMTSMSAIIRAIFRLCPAAKEHTAQCAKSWSSLPSQCLPSMPFLERDPAMDGLREQRCIDFYFDNVHAITPLLDEDEFRAHYQAGTRQDASWKGLLYMVFTLGSVASGSDSLHEHYYRHARSFVTLDNLGCGNIESLQALCLLGGYYLHYRNSPNMAYSVLGAAHRVAIALGLHREPRHRPARASSTGPGSGTDANEAELSRRRVETRRKTWWSLFCLDTWGAMTQGRPTCGRWDSTTMDTQFPVASSPDDYCIQSLVASARFCLICDRMQQCFARFGRLTTQEIIDYDAELVRWYEGLPPSITDPLQSPLRFNIAREFMRTRYLNARMLLTRSSFLYIASGSSRRGIADLAPEPRQLLETCCSVASETVDAIALYWTPNRVHVWNAGWYLFQACMTPLLSLAVDRNMSAGSAASKDSVAAWRACLAKALETFYEMRPWMRPSDRSPDIVSAMYEALISDYDGQLSTPSGTGASLDMAGWYDDHMNDLDWSIVLGGEPLSFQGIFSTP